MMESTIRFAQNNLTGIAKTGLSILVAATTISMTMATEDPAEFPGKGTRADFDSAGEHYNRAIALGRQGKDLEACEEYKRAISIYPYKAGYYYNYGRKLNKLNRLSEAIDLYKKAIQLDPEFVEAYCNMGDLLTKQGKYCEAEAACRRGLELDSTYVIGKINLAEAFIGERKMEEAVKWLKSAKSSPDAGEYEKDIDDDLAKCNATVGK